MDIRNGPLSGVDLRFSPTQTCSKLGSVQQFPTSIRIVCACRVSYVRCMCVLAMGNTLGAFITLRGTWW